MSFDINAFVTLEEDTDMRQEQRLDEGPAMMRSPLSERVDSFGSSTTLRKLHDDSPTLLGQRLPSVSLSLQDARELSEPVINIEPPQEDCAPTMLPDKEFFMYNAHGIPLQESPMFAENPLHFGASMNPVTYNTSPSTGSFAGSIPSSPSMFPPNHGSPGSHLLGSPAIENWSSRSSSVVESPNMGIGSPMVESGDTADSVLSTAEFFEVVNDGNMDPLISFPQLSGGTHIDSTQSPPMMMPAPPHSHPSSAGSNPPHNHQVGTGSRPGHSQGLGGLLSVPNVQRSRAVSDPWGDDRDAYGPLEHVISSCSASPGTTSVSSASLSPDGSPQIVNLSPQSPGRIGRETVITGSLGVPVARPRSHSTPYEYEPKNIAADTMGSGVSSRRQKHPLLFSCELCSKKFTRAYNLRSHMRTHTDERPFACRLCGKSFARQHDRKRHEELHSGEKKFICFGADPKWGCSRRFARADALGRHFRTEAGKACLQPLVEKVRENGSNAFSAPEGIVYYGSSKNGPHLALLDGNPSEQSRRTVLMTAVSEQLAAP